MFNQQKGFIKIAIITIIAFIIATAGHFILTQKNIEAPAIIQESDTADKTAQLTDEKSATKDWKTYRNEEYGFDVEYPTDIFHLDKNTNTLSHTLKNFHKYSMKDGSDIGLANDISIVFKKENDKGCNWLEEELDLKSIGVPFEFKNIKGVKYETGAEGEGVAYYCVKNKDNQNIFLIERWFLNASYSTELSKQNDYIDGGKQEEIFDKILSTFKFNKQ